MAFKRELRTWKQTVRSNTLELALPNGRNGYRIETERQVEVLQGQG